MFFTELIHTLKDRFQTGVMPDAQSMSQCLLPHDTQSMSPCHVRCTSVMSDAQKCHFGCTVSFRICTCLDSILKTNLKVWSDVMVGKLVR